MPIVDVEGERRVKELGVGEGGLGREGKGINTGLLKEDFNDN